MARYAIENRLVQPEQLRGFDAEGYGFDAARSEPQRYVFRRKVEN